MTDIPDFSPSRAITEHQHERLVAPDPQDTKAIIDRYKLKRIDANMPLRRYFEETVSRQQFIRSYAGAQVKAANNQNALGMWWVVLNPTLNAAVYWLVFGKILGQDASIPNTNFLSFVVIGVFSMEFMTQCLGTGTVAITGNLGLVRALQFPRAVLPITVVYREFIEQLIKLGVMIVIILITLEWPSPMWLGFPILVVLEFLFCLSIAFVVARIGNTLTDFKNFVPFIARVWLMLSGAVFFLQSTWGGYPKWMADILIINPGFVYLELSRHLLLDNYAIVGPSGASLVAYCWAAAFFWAIVPLPFAYIYFWRGEHTYGKS